MRKIFTFSHENFLTYTQYYFYFSPRLHVVHGNRWATIGKKLGVSARAAQDKFRSLDKRKKKGEQRRRWKEDG